MRANSIKRGALIGLAIIGLTLPATAMAGDEDRARAAVAEARGKIEAAEKAGVGGEAADGLARARAALERAQKAVRDDNEDAAYHDAKEADALADLASATSELRKLETERQQLAGK
ncbi:hypothetical protein ACFB49_38320 [Sphingomonas sp. DBB INV C78]|uniref:DUF4398 domain-containing protein n=1 Tax=Sphingomonas sp. DBB INV C78 TaxID=3349434 RepID=UPI0036D43F60